MNPAISIQLNSTQAFFLPGQTLSGTYAFSGVAREEIQRVELSVLWFTEGKGDEDLGVHFFESIQWEEGEAAEPSGRNRVPGGAFSVELPQAPVSYYGKVLKIHWDVRVRLFLSGERSYNESRRFTVGDVPPVDVALN